MSQKLWSAKELEGTFCMCCCPMCCGCYKQTAEGEDVLVANGWCFLFNLIPCAITNDKKYRVGNTNSFAEKGKADKEDDLEKYTSPGFMSAGGLACASKVC